MVCFLYGCKSYKLKEPCASLNKTIKNDFKKSILAQIDSVYMTKKTTDGNSFEKIINANCINDSIYEVKILNKLFIYDLFYFDNDLKLIEIKHELQDLH